MRRICFVGTYPYHDDPEFSVPDDSELWVVNEAHRNLPEWRKPSIVFQLHVRDWREAERTYLNGGTLPSGRDHNCFGRDKDHVEYLRTCGVPVYGQQEWLDIPTSIVYPIELVRETVGVELPPLGMKRLWAASSWGYMAALLLTEHLRGGTVDEWMLYGVELPLGSQRERLWEWPNLAYYLGMARGLGITITLPGHGSALLSSPHYAVDARPQPGDADHWFVPGHLAIVADGGLLRLGTMGWDKEMS